MGSIQDNHEFLARPTDAPDLGIPGATTAVEVQIIDRYGSVDDDAIETFVANDYVHQYVEVGGSYENVSTANNRGP